VQCFITTMPKTGSHLLWHILGMNKEESTVQDFLLTRADGRLIKTKCRFYPNGITGHIPYSRGAVGLTANMHRFTLLRDPRDTIVSWYYYVDAIREGHPFERFVTHRGLKNYHGEKRLTEIIKQLVAIFDDFLPWLDERIIPLRYEELINAPEVALEPVAMALGEPLDVLVERSLYRGSETFRRGEPGAWREEFTEEHIEQFDALYGHIMDAWGYANTD